MMDPSGTHNFEDQWRKALGDASETPPPSVWSKIEARLDQEENNKVIPLWWQSRKIWYAAASVAAIILVAGLWLTNMPRHNQQIIAKTEAPQANQQTSQDESLAAKTTPEDDKSAISQTGSEPDQTLLKGEGQTIASADVPAKSSRNSGSARSAFGRKSNVTAAYSAETKSSFENKITNADDLITSDATVAQENLSVTKENALSPSPQLINAEMLAALPYSDLDVHVQKRYVFFKSENRVEEVVKPAAPKEYYAGIGLMPAAFNPDVRIKEAPQAFATQAFSTRRAVSGSSETGVGYAIQTNGGMRLSKHWSLEMGVNYLKGNSAYEGSGYVMSAYNSQAANALENALATIAAPSNMYGDVAKSANGAKNEYLSNNAVYIDVTKKVANNYQYLQLPFQAGFTMNPEKKLSYSLIGGVMANFFLANELESASGEIITTKASDEVYRSLNWAATTGLRFNYKLSSKWKANLTGSYQKAVSSGFRSNQSLEAHPYLYGVSWGVRYSF